MSKCITIAVFVRHEYRKIAGKLPQFVRKSVESYPNKIMKNNTIIRLERESDHRMVENLTREAFWNVYRPGCTIPLLTFGPISIAPEYKRKGYGLRLMTYAIDRARDMGYGAIFMEGNP